MFEQHMPSNSRTHTDNYLAEMSTEFSYERNREQIALLKESLEYITISDRAIAEIREESGNTLTRGDAAALILAKEFKDGYTGLIDVNRDDVAEESEQDILQVKKRIAPLGAKAPKKNIDNAFYCYDTNTTYYFLK